MAECPMSPVQFFGPPKNPSKTIALLLLVTFVPGIDGDIETSGFVKFAFLNQFLHLYFFTTLFHKDFKRYS